MQANTSVPAYTCDVLIVGGGMSGLFAGWRLLQNNPNLKVIIVEKQGWCGGRLETTTVNIQGTDGNYYPVKDEEGGMRFVQEGTGMENLWQLINDFQLQPVPFVMGNSSNRYYFRGQSFTFGQASDNSIWKGIFNLAPSEQNLAPTAILNEVIQAVLKQNNCSQIPNSPEAWIEFRNTFTYNGVPVNQWGLWAMLRNFGLTEECIEWLSRVIGFMGCLEAYINAGEALQILFDFPAAPSFNTLENGFQSLPNALVNAFVTAGGLILNNVRVTHVVKSETAYGVMAQVEGQLKPVLFTATQVILAVPKNALEKIMERSPVLSENTSFAAAVKSVQDMELTKIGLYFNQRWWHQNTAIGITNGPSFNDLPIGTVYCFSQYPTNSAQDAAYNGPAALTVYTDFIRGNFWKEIQNVGPAYTSPEFPNNPTGSYPASTALVNEAMLQIKMLFGLDPNDASVPMPVLSTYRVWGQGKFGFGYHQYRLNVDDRLVYKNIWNPAPNIYVCNESWSPEQGWVEGALIATDLVLVNGFNLSPFVSVKPQKAAVEATEAKVKNALV